jgi:hypothetical protein
MAGLSTGKTAVAVTDGGSEKAPPTGAGQVIGYEASQARDIRCVSQPFVGGCRLANLRLALSARKVKGEIVWHVVL